MYAGEIVERGSLADVFRDNVHPYTAGLLGSVPDLESVGGSLDPVSGNVPSLLDHEMADRCYFADRCPKAMEACLERPHPRAVDDDGEHLVNCVLGDVSYGDSPPLPDDYFDAPDGNDPSEAATDDGEGTTAGEEPASTDGGESR